MKPWTKIMTGGLSAVALIGVFISKDQKLIDLNVDSTVLVASTNLLLVYLVFAAFIERGCEVAMNMLTALGVVAPKSNAPNAPQQTDRSMVSSVICLVFAIGISLAGLRLIEMILNVASVGKLSDLGDYFKIVDVFLTALILAGGSEGIHKIIGAIEGEDPPQNTTTDQQLKGQTK